METVVLNLLLRKQREAVMQVAEGPAEGSPYVHLKHEGIKNIRKKTHLNQVDALASAS